MEALRLIFHWSVSACGRLLFLLFASRVADARNNRKNDITCADTLQWKTSLKACFHISVITQRLSLFLLFPSSVVENNKRHAHVETDLILTY